MAIQISGTNGVNLVQDNVTPSIMGLRKNLQLSTTGLNGAVTVTADALALESLTYGYVIPRNIALSINVATGGLNGIDTGVAATSTWYSVWAIWNGVAVNGLLSLSGTNPTLPVGYTHKARVGWIYTDATGNKYPLPIKQFDRKIQYVVTPASNLVASRVLGYGTTGNIVTPTWTAAPWAALAPTTAASLKFLCQAGGGNGTGVILAPNNNYGAFNSTNPMPVYLYGTTSISGQNCIVDLIPESANFYWASSAAYNGVYVMGWEDNL